MSPLYAMLSFAGSLKSFAESDIATVIATYISAIHLWTHFKRTLLAVFSLIKIVLLSHISIESVNYSGQVARKEEQFRAKVWRGVSFQFELKQIISN